MPNQLDYINFLEEDGFIEDADFGKESQYTKEKYIYRKETKASSYIRVLFSVTKIFSHIEFRYEYINFLQFRVAIDSFDYDNKIYMNILNMAKKHDYFYKTLAIPSIISRCCLYIKSDNNKLCFRTDGFSYPKFNGLILSEEELKFTYT